MSNFKIGVIIDSFRLSLKESIQKAKEVGAQGIQVYAIDGEMAPENLNSGKIVEINDMLQSNGLVISALCGDFGGYGFTIPEDNALKIERSKRIVDLALELGSNVITTHVGCISPNKGNEKRKIIQDACVKLGEYAEKNGAAFAIETGSEKAEVLKEFLDELPNKGVKVNFDPANLVMVTGDDPVKDVYTLKDYIVHTHAKDGVMLKQADPEIVYDIIARGGIGTLALDTYFKEVPLGQGQVNFDLYLDALCKIGYNGFLTIEREVGDNPEKDIKTAVEFLKGKIAR